MERDDDLVKSALKAVTGKGTDTLLVRVFQSKFGLCMDCTHGLVGRHFWATGVMNDLHMWQKLVFSITF